MPTFHIRSPLCKRAAIVAVSVGALLVGCNNPPEVIKIGVAQPLSGNLAALGQDSLNGVKLAVDEINKQGFKLKGKTVKLEIVAVDDRADPAHGVEVARQLVESGIVAVIGHFNSGVSIPAAPIYAEKHIAQLTMSTNPKFTTLGFPTTLRVVANDNMQARAMGFYAANHLSATKFAVVDDGTLYGKGLAEGAVVELKKAKKDIVVRQSFDDKTTDFTMLAEKIKDSNIEVIVTTLGDFQVLALLDALKKIDYTRVTVLGGDTLKTSDMLKTTGIAGAIYATSTVIEAREFVAGPGFLERYRAAFKVEPAYGSHYTYDTMYVLASAIGKAGSADPDKITQTLRNMDGYAPVTGSLKWDSNGEQRYGVVGVYSVRGGRWELQMRSDRW